MGRLFLFQFLKRGRYRSGSDPYRLRSNIPITRPIAAEIKIV